MIDPRERTHFRHPKLTAAFVLSAAVLLLYSVSLGHNFLFDEDDIILLNPLMRDLGSFWKFFLSGYFQKAQGLDTIWEQYYRPLTSLTFAVDFRLWGVNPLGYNLTNTVLHAGVSYLFFLLLLRIFKDPLIALPVSLLWAVHTIHTEAVTYIASRGDLLGGLFTLAALLLYWRGFDRLVLGIYALALFSKESTLLMPLYLITLDAVFIRTSRRRLVARIAPLLMLGVCYVVFRKLWSPVPMGPPTFDAKEAFLRFLSMGAPFLEYLRALVAPEAFKFCDSIDYARRFTDPQVLTTLGVQALLLAAWLLAMRRRGAAFFALTVFFLSYGPSLQIIPFVPEWAEHYLYVPSMGLAILLACLAREALASGRKGAAVSLAAVYAAFTLFVGYRTLQRNEYYADIEKYYHALSRSSSPYAYYGHINLGIIAVMKGSWDEAAVPLLTAWRIFPETESNNYNLGLYYFHKGLYSKAAQHFQKAYETEYGRHQPVNLLGWGSSLMRQKLYDEAIVKYLQALEKLPKVAAVYRNLARANFLSNRPSEALEWLDKGLAATRGDKPSVDHGILLAERMLLGFLSGDDALFDSSVESMASYHADSKWFGPAGKFLDGQMDWGEYETLVQEEYPYNAKDSRLYMLMRAVRRGDHARIEEFMVKYAEPALADSDDPEIITMILERARSASSAH